MDSDEMYLSQEIPYIGNLSRIGQQIDCCLIHCLESKMG